MVSPLSSITRKLVDTDSLSASGLGLVGADLEKTAIKADDQMGKMTSRSEQAPGSRGVRVITPEDAEKAFRSCQSNYCNRFLSQIKSFLNCFNIVKYYRQKRVSRAAMTLIAHFKSDSENLSHLGIFRENGGKAKTEELMDKLMRTPSTIDTLKGVTPRNKADALKKLFKQLELFENPELRNEFVKIGVKINAEKISTRVLIESLQDLVNRLSPAQKENLKQIIELSVDIVKQQALVNGLTSKGLAALVGPTLCPVLIDPNNRKEMQNAGAVLKLIALTTQALIENCKDVFI